MAIYPSYKFLIGIARLSLAIVNCEACEAQWSELLSYDSILAPPP